MIFVALRAGLGGLAVGALVIGALGLRTPATAVDMARPSDTVLSSEPRDSTAESGALVNLAERMTPFRLDHRVPQIRFGETLPPPPTPPPPKPALVLHGIVWGASPAVILEGLPGREAQVVLRQGESDGVFRVRRIERDRVEVTGLDTTWVLQVREPWR